MRLLIILVACLVLAGCQGTGQKHVTILHVETVQLPNIEINP
jgi:uncharacterized lipoprotein YajG